MKCYQPILITWDKTKEAGKRFENGLLVPCRHCIACKEETAKEWTIRYIHEKQTRKLPNTAMLTLTYDNDSLPITNNYHMTLRKKDIIDYLKRVRMRINRKAKEQPSIKTDFIHYTGAEYGDQKNRPHYHMILSYGRKQILNMFIKAWEERFGHVQVEERATIRAIYYTIGYTSEKIYKREDFSDGRTAPFRKMTRGLGKTWAKNNIEKLKDELSVRLRQYKVGIPRYYKKIMSETGDWIEDKNVSQKIADLKREARSILINFYQARYKGNWDTHKTKETYYKNNKYVEIIQGTDFNEAELQDRIQATLNQKRRTYETKYYWRIKKTKVQFNPL